MPFYAHSLTQKTEEHWQLLKDHLENASTLAADFGAAFNCRDWAAWLAFLHDLGKYSHLFQKRLRGGSRVDHSLAGALEAMRLLEQTGLKSLRHIAAHVISGHHTGLADGIPTGNAGVSLKERLAGRGKLPDYSAWASELSLPPLPAAPPALKRENAADCAFAFFFWARMLFSCLVDADFLDTEAFIQPERAALRGGYPLLETLAQKLDETLAQMAAQAKPSPVNDRRAEVLAACRRAAAQTPGLFSLTVPTGGGKTLSSLAFAFDHAKKHNLRRIIYVIPYTSIIEQTAGVFRRAFGPELAHAVLEHHSNVAETEKKSPEDADDLEDARSLAFENWDAPIIVTTAVQFFESLFAARSSRCRKLHRIAQSVVVLDEAQTLPPALLRPCLAAVKELAASYGTSFVLCTATQPEVGVKPWNRNGLTGVREITPDVPALFQALERVDVEFIGQVEMEDLAERLRGCARALCIVNTRPQARDLAEALHGAGQRVFHLSTWMCAAHRKEVLARVQEMLADETQPDLLLVATSLIEAGVDIDFPIVYRAMAGLDSIAQAAGRCNREGRLPRGHTFVFDLPATARGEQSRRQSACRAVLRAGLPFLSPAATAMYFDELYSVEGAGGLDQPGILRRAAETAKQCLFPFRSVEKDFRFIRDYELPLLIPYNDEARAALALLRENRVSRPLYRKLQQWTVGVPERSLAALLAAGSIEAVGPAGQHYALLNEDLYSGLRGNPRPDSAGLELGLDIRNPAFMEIDSGIF